MRAVIADPSVPGNLRIAEVADPTPDSTEALIRVSAFSVNRGEVKRAEVAEAGQPIGWDTMGVVERPAGDGSGPPAGTRVVGFSKRMQGWAELVALPTRDLAAVPDGVSDADASTLPVAGLTALYALERCPRLLANRVLITGASGGVGYFACQLGTLMGADVVSVLRRADHRDMVEGTGARVMIASSPEEIAALGRFHVIIDGVGGEQFGRLVSLLEPGGRAVVYGVSAGADTTLGLRDLMFTGDGRIDGFHLYRESEVESCTLGLTRLLSLLESGRIRTVVSQVSDWGEVASVASGLISRDYPGKAVLTL